MSRRRISSGRQVGPSDTCSRRRSLRASGRDGSWRATPRLKDPGPAFGGLPRLPAAPRERRPRCRPVPRRPGTPTASSSPPPRTCLSVVGESKVKDLHAASSRCLPYQAYDIFEGREGPMRLAPKLGEIALEPEPLPQARVEGEDHDGASADDAPHLREGGSRVGEVVQGEYPDGALRATIGQRQPLSGRGHPTDTENLSRLPPHVAGSTAITR